MTYHNPYQRAGPPTTQQNGGFMQAVTFPQAGGSLPFAPFGGVYSNAPGDNSKGFPQAQSGSPTVMSPHAMSINPAALLAKPQNGVNGYQTHQQPQQQQPQQQLQQQRHPVASTSAQSIDPRAFLQSRSHSGPIASQNSAQVALAATTHLAPSPENVQWNRAYPNLKSELDKMRMIKSPLRAGKRIIEILAAFDTGRDVPIVGRREVLSILTSSPAPPPELFQAMAEATNGVELFDNWLREAYKAHKGKAKEDDKADEQLKFTLSSILRVLNALPVTVNQLKASRLGTIVAAIATDASAKPADRKFTKPAHELATAIKTKWWNEATLASKAPANDSKRRPEPLVEDTARKKPKIEVKSEMKKAAKAASPPVSQSGPDLSFLPSTKPATAASLKNLSIGRKKSAPQPKESTPPLSTPVSSSVPVVKSSGFAEALSAMKPKEASASSADAVRRSKKKRSVHWPDDDAALVAVRYIERREDAGHTEHMNVDDARQLDINEGRRFSGHMEEEEMEEEVTWSQPRDVRVPAPQDPNQMPPTYPDPESLTVFTRAEADVQAERESCILSVSYDGDGDMPPSPAEPAVAMDEAGAVVKDIPLAAKFMALPAVQQALHYMASNDYSTPSGNPGDYLQSAEQFKALLGQLSGPVGSAMGESTPTLEGLAAALGTNRNANALDLLQNTDLNALKAALGVPASDGGDATINNGMHFWGDAITGLTANTGPMRSTAWQQAAGSGTENHAPKRRITKPYSGKKKVPCKFYGRGDCREGDACTFSHNLTS